MANSQSDADAHFMRLALEQAQAAYAKGEVPVGAVVVKDGMVIGVGHNAPITQHDPSAHAEVQALRDAAYTLGNYRLDGCFLYVTLEPCAMCAGAMLHARIQRLVYGAAEPKTGAAGSVVSLFDEPRLNHQTAVCAGVLADECTRLLQTFFKQRRADMKERPYPLREDALRTPEARFSGLPDYPWEPKYVQSLSALEGLRMHYLDEGPSSAPLTFLCLHDNFSWSHQYRSMIPVWVKAGVRIVAPDLIGFGKSDKPKKQETHNFAFHRAALLALVEYLDLRNVVLVVPARGSSLGLTLPMAAVHRYKGMLLVSHDQNPANDAPFLDAGHRAAPRAFVDMVPDRQYPDPSGTLLPQMPGDFSDATAEAAMRTFLPG